MDQHPIAHQLNNRHQAALRLPPLEDGHRDPIQRNLKDNRTPLSLPVALRVLYINGHIDRDTLRNLWHAYPNARPDIEEYVAAHREGWATCDS